MDTPVEFLIVNEDMYELYLLYIVYLGFPPKNVGIDLILTSGIKSLYCIK